MNSLIFMFILWVIFRVFSDRTKDRRQPMPTSPAEEASTYQLPPDLRRKWGPPLPQEEVEPAETSTQPKKYKVAATVPATVTPIKKIEKQMPAASEEAIQRAEQSPAPSTCPAGIGKLNPAMLQQGIILSEILGPPMAKRRRNSVFH
ncbi:hypothetical protein [Desulforamulus aeronauticus]|uniref:Uncharacterized protein n=1 Tax=Desulforamulus aeronauticus DSM 10349 TaxID=1121421 RepID=A0A1M6VE24_9FIRM|nr:hypothetical protein [Desulforamulus aeronauticus]SHK79585.1 hypothetical protein SAMN02745123_03150 [Desulforamulus aeronauticus DSM 10349]